MSLSRIHGGADALGAPRHDFSTNSHAAGPCPAALAAVQAADTTHYPDAAYTALRAQLAAFHGVAPERVLLAGSASEFIFRVTAWVAQQGGQEVWLPPHHYGDYAAAAQAWGLLRTDDAAQSRLAWACDPSSPLGQAQPGLADLAARSPVLVLDRAYEPLRLDGALALTQEQLLRVWQLWTPNKALGLTGVRAACVIAPLGALEAVEQLERLCPSWPVGAQGVALLQAWTQDAVQAWLRESLVTLRAWKARQIGVCESLGWTCEPSLTNYFCARPDLQGDALSAALQALRAQGIKLRDTTSFGLPGGVRLGVLAPAAQDALAVAWQEIRQQISRESLQGVMR
jgi:histidinol-phosphate aminotransferase